MQDTVSHLPVVMTPYLHCDPSSTHISALLALRLFFIFAPRRPLSEHLFRLFSQRPVFFWAFAVFPAGTRQAAPWAAGCGRITTGPFRPGALGLLPGFLPEFPGSPARAPSRDAR